MAAITRSILISTGLGALLTVSEPALARGNDAAAADALFQQGMQDMEAGKYESACQKFRDSDQLDPTVNTKFNLGDCEEKRGKLATVGLALAVVGLGPGTYFVLSSRDSGKAETALVTEVGPTSSRVSVAVRR